MGTPLWTYNLTASPQTLVVPAAINLGVTIIPASPSPISPRSHRTQWVSPTHHLTYSRSFLTAGSRVGSESFLQPTLHTCPDRSPSTLKPKLLAVIPKALPNPYSAAFSCLESHHSFPLMLCRHTQQISVPQTHRASFGLWPFLHSGVCLELCPHSPLGSEEASLFLGSLLCTPGNLVTCLLCVLR